MRADRDLSFLPNSNGDRDTVFSSTLSNVRHSKHQKVTPLRSQDKNRSPHSLNNTKHPQTRICDFFTEIASSESPQSAIDYFQDLFILKSDRVGKAIEQSLYDLIVLNCEEDFFILLDRCCSILIKQWIVTKQEKYIAVLLNVLKKEISSYKSLQPTRRRLKEWILGFVESKYFQSLQAFLPDGDRQKIEATAPWKNRYIAYILTAQYFNPDYPREHREVAKLLAYKSNKQFKFKLALCLARANLPKSSQRINQNPTTLNLRTLCLIQQILVKRKNINYQGLANIFLKQTEGMVYKDFKKSLLKYLLFSLKQGQTSTWLQASIAKYLESLYSNYNDKIVDSNLLLRTCKRLIVYLLNPDWEISSHPFTILTRRGNYITLAMLLLKIILICQSSYKYLIFCTVELIQENETQPEAECQWLIGFIETLRVVLAISQETEEITSNG
ncbi:hypothetical protein [Spirulina sp. 06S082]|uniref:hypothetical protein n=1 Tax=Spirulina sp. 06S082 TaxID=3110248 RepID=UPI002B20BB6C|nr:hypothetical protein [Spirulina sp. 06S082]MEA5472219.1 hypothetical protein [Spirulina sp. 06S082]